MNNLIRCFTTKFICYLAGNPLIYAGSGFMNRPPTINNNPLQLPNSSSNVRPPPFYPNMFANNANSSSQKPAINTHFPSPLQSPVSPAFHNGLNSSEQQIISTNPFPPLLNHHTSNHLASHPSNAHQQLLHELFNGNPNALAQTSHYTNLMMPWFAANSMALAALSNSANG